MKDLTVIIPIEVLDTTEKQELFIAALSRGGEKKRKIMSNAAKTARFVKTDNNPPQKVKKQY